MLLSAATIHLPQQNGRFAVKSFPIVIPPAYLMAKVTRLYSVLEVAEGLQWRISGLNV
jgi:hypothetical protein